MSGDRIPTDPAPHRRIRPATEAALSLGMVLLRSRQHLERVAYRATGIEARARAGEVSAADVAQLATDLQTIALALLNVEAAAALRPPDLTASPPPVPPPAPVSRWVRAWRAFWSG